MESGEKKPRRAFFREIYWFVVICLIGWVVAVALVPPRASKYWTMLEIESKLASRNAGLKDQAGVLKARAESMDTDPLYKVAETRKVLNVKRKTENYLKIEDTSVR